MYSRVLNVTAVVFKYKLPFAADNVGTPVPKNTPRFVVLDISMPDPVEPPATGAVPLKI
jgi:hypothetical protein